MVGALDGPAALTLKRAPSACGRNTAADSRSGFDLLEADAADAESPDAGAQRRPGGTPAKKNWNKRNKRTPAAPETFQASRTAPDRLNEAGIPKKHRAAARKLFAAGEYTKGFWLSAPKAAPRQGQPQAQHRPAAPVATPTKTPMATYTVDQVCDWLQGVIKLKPEASATPARLCPVGRLAVPARRQA